MKIHESAQDYLETILILKLENSRVKSIDVAKKMNVTKQSVHRAIKNLAENDYITIEEGNISLTEKGNEIATKMYERHTLLASFFISLGVDKEIAFEDACKIEHDISDQSFDAIRKLLDKGE